MLGCVIPADPEEQTCKQLLAVGTWWVEGDWRQVIDHGLLFEC